MLFLFVSVILQNYSKIHITVQHPTYCVYRKLAKLLNTTRNPSSYVMFDAKIGKPTCFCSFSYGLYNVAFRRWIWLVPASSYNKYIRYCSTAVLCRGPAMLLPRGCRGHATGKRKGGLEGRRGGGGRGREGMHHSTNQYHSRLVHRIMFEPIVWTHCLNPMHELTSNIDLENHVPILEIQHRLGKSCSHVGNPTSVWKAMYPFWTPNIDSNIHVPIWTPNIDSDVNVPM